MNRKNSEESAEKGSQEGALLRRSGAPLAGVWGCPPDIIYSPFLIRKGDRGMVKKISFPLPVKELLVRH